MALIGDCSLIKSSKQTFHLIKFSLKMSIHNQCSKDNDHAQHILHIIYTYVLLVVKQSLNPSSFTLYYSSKHHVCQYVNRCCLKSELPNSGQKVITLTNKHQIRRAKTTNQLISLFFYKFVGVETNLPPWN